MNKLIQDSSNGVDQLKNEIKSSDARLRAVKSGIPLSTVVPKREESFYVPEL